MSDLGKKDGKLLVRYSPLRLQVGCACCPPPPPPPPPPPDVCGCDSIQEIEDLVGQYYAPMTMIVQRSGTGIVPRVTGSYTQAQSDWITDNISATVVVPFSGVVTYQRILCAAWTLYDVTDGMFTDARIYIPCDTPEQGLILNGFVYYERGSASTPTQVGDKFFTSVSADFPASVAWDAAWNDYPTLRDMCGGSPKNWEFTGYGGVSSEVTLPVAGEFDVNIQFGAL